MDKRIILDTAQMQLTIDRLCYELYENYQNIDQVAIIGIQPRGVFLAEKIVAQLQELCSKTIQYGSLDITFHRDDFKTKSKTIKANATTIDFLIEGKQVIIIDDVLYTGRTIRAALDALMSFGRPKSVELLTLIDRRFNRELPIQADYIGKVVDTVEPVEVQVEWNDNPNVFFL